MSRSIFIAAMFASSILGVAVSHAQSGDTKCGPVAYDTASRHMWAFLAPARRARVKTAPRLRQINSASARQRSVAPSPMTPLRRPMSVFPVPQAQPKRTQPAGRSRRLPRQ